VKALPNPFLRDLEAARQMTMKNDVAGARIALEAILAKDPGNEQAKTLLAGTYLFSDPGRAVEIVRSIEEHSEQFPAADAIATIGMLLEKGAHPDTLPVNPVKGTYTDAIQKLRENNFDAAVEKFIEVIKQDRMYEDDGARRAVVAIFRILGDSNEIVLKHRRSFSSALYS
jgi:putative thioredoxin